MPSVQGKVTAEQKGADVSEKEEELDRILMRPVPETQSQGHSQVHGTKETKQEQIEHWQAPRSVPRKKIISMNTHNSEKLWKLFRGNETTWGTNEIVSKETGSLWGN